MNRGPENPETSGNPFSGAGDDGFNRPTVTPVPAPPDDQLIRLAAVSSVIGAVLTAVFLRWVSKHLEIRWR